MIDTILKFVNVLLNSGSVIWEAFKAVKKLFKSEVYMSRRRHKLSRKASKRIFRKGVSRTKVLNTRATPMRGGFRI